MQKTGESSAVQLQWHSAGLLYELIQKKVQYKEGKGRYSIGFELSPGTVAKVQLIFMSKGYGCRWCETYGRKGWLEERFFVLQEFGWHPSKELIEQVALHIGKENRPLA
jgi:hypothetical protein